MMTSLRYRWTQLPFLLSPCTVPIQLRFYSELHCDCDCVCVFCNALCSCPSLASACLTWLLMCALWSGQSWAHLSSISGCTFCWDPLKAAPVGMISQGHIKVLHMAESTVEQHQRNIATLILLSFGDVETDSGGKKNKLFITFWTQERCWVKHWETLCTIHLK